MKQLSTILLEKLKITKDTDSVYSDEQREISAMFDDEESRKTLKFLLNFIRRSKSGPFKDTVFSYWDMYINKNKFSCMHSGWSRDGVGHQKSAYIHKVVSNYNADNGTDIYDSISGWSADAGVPVLKIKEVVDALKRKFDNVDIEDKDLVSVNI